MTAQHVRPDRTVLACRIVGDDRWCGRCGCKGVARDTVIRHVAHEPDGWHPTVLHVSVSLLPVPGVCSCVVPGHDHSSRPARETLARGGALGGRWAWLSTILAVVRIAQALGVSWNTANTSVLSKEASARSSTIRIVVMVCAIGVDEHVSRHTPLRRQLRHHHRGRNAHQRPQWSLASPEHTQFGMASMFHGLFHTSWLGPPRSAAVPRSAGIRSGAPRIRRRPSLGASPRPASQRRARPGAAHAHGD